jgi:hypothetical protein
MELLSDKVGNSRRMKHFWRVRETVATKRNIGDLRNQDNRDSNGDKRNIGNIGNQDNHKSVVTIVTKVVINIRGFPYEVPVTFVKL